ncbi:hypothetical protein [Kitasatospora sp. NPDC090091]|uniref:hypothetical protein n=1 Tax=Kitasatospora sp. NPDC090091 TaxID=3364081 RepID=UPI00380982DA
MKLRGRSEETDREAQDAPEPPVGELVRSIREHPSRLPETLAVFAVRHRGPRAARRIAALRAAHPDAAPDELVGLVVERGRRVSTSEGAFVGGPFLWLVPFAFCTALLAQGQLLLELAALAGRDPADRARIPELMVLQGAYPDVAIAERALAAEPGADTADLPGHEAGPEAGPGAVPGPEAGAERTAEVPAEVPAAGGRPAAGPAPESAAAPEAAPAAPATGRWRSFWYLIWRMARLLGLTSEGTDPPPSRWHTAGEWALVGAVLLIGTVAPLVWLPYMAYSYNRATDRVAATGVSYYFGGHAAGWLEPGRSRTDPGLVAATFQALVSVLVPVGTVLFLLATDIRLAESRWPVLALALVVVSGVVGTLWYRSHRPRRRRRETPPAP